MKNLKIESKADEIEILRALAAAPSYFADYFTIEIDLPQMIYNIENDLPLLMTTVNVSKAESIERDLRSAVKEKNDLLEETLDLLSQATKELSKSETCLAETRESLRREKERAHWFLRDVMKFYMGFQSDIDPEKYFGKSEILIAKLHANLPLTNEELNTIDSILNQTQL